MNKNELDVLMFNERNSEELLKETLQENNELKYKIKQIKPSRLLTDRENCDQTQKSDFNL